jgi:NAD(P)-dependent dehydrogenase (short-subunit alcohol dehydrogenase family)
MKHALSHGVDSITITTGTATERPFEGATLSVAGSGALMIALRTAAVDCAPVRINCISPGVVKTELWDAFPEEQRKNAFESYEKKLPVRHVGTPEELAEAVSTRKSMWARELRIRAVPVRDEVYISNRPDDLRRRWPAPRTLN